jgi:hypothetical protein
MIKAGVTVARAITPDLIAMRLTSREFHLLVVAAQRASTTSSLA